MQERELLSIKEFAKLTGIKQSTLRHYDEIKLFQPIKRGENNYRYYSVPQTVAVNCIKVMHSLKIPVKKLSEFKKKKTPEDILELLQKHELDLNRELFQLQQAYSLIHTYCGLIQEGLFADEETICRQRMPETPIEIGSLNDFSSGGFYESFFAFNKKMADLKINPVYPTGGYYEDISAFMKTPGWPNRFFSYVPTGRDMKAAGEYLVGYARGYYGEIGDLPQRIQEYADDQGLKFTGPVYEIYLHNEICVDDPDQYLIQISAPVKKERTR